MRAFLFPGQGSQVKGMGAELFDEFPQLTNKADEILNYSIKTLCLDNPNGQLNQTQFTQPAIFVVNALKYLKQIKENSIKPDFVAGHSLGEFSALFAASVIDFDTGLQLVQKRGELMSQVSGGSMAAIIGLKSEAITNKLYENKLSSIAIANHNSYTQIVISGLKKEIDEAQVIFKNTPGVSFIPLKVSGAFHSPHMLEPQRAFADFLENFKFHTPHIPVIANTNALPYHPSIIKKNLIQQITNTVLWTSTIEYLNNQGMQVFEEIGPGNVLTGLLQRIQQGH